MDDLQFSNALAEIWKLVGRTNKYIDETMPWILAKSEDQKPRLGTVLYNLAESLRFISVLISPFMPATPDRIRQQLGIEGLKDLQSWDSLSQFGKIPAGTRVQRGNPIFPRLDVKKELEELETTLPTEGQKEDKQDKSKESKKDKDESKKDAQGKAEITIDDFAKLDLRVARVIAAEKVANSDRLLKLQLKVGNETRQVVSGIAEHYSAEELVGKDLILVANLKPVKLRGNLSQGMILAASNEDGKLSLVTVDREIEPGSTVS